jgi:putative hydrolase of the HAD superfamily
LFIPDCARVGWPDVVLFDLDDKLLDHGTAMGRAVARVHGVLALATPLDAFSRKWRDASERCYRRYLAKEISFAEQRRARVRTALEQRLSDREVDESFSHYVVDYERSWTLFYDVLPCLDSLAGVRLGLLSKGAAIERRRKLLSLGLLGRFALVLTSEEAGAAKPSPAIFQHACAALGVTVADAVHVGDRCDLDAIAANRAGLRGVWLNRCREPHPLGQTVRSIAGLDELAPLLAARF